MREKLEFSTTRKEEQREDIYSSLMTCCSSQKEKGKEVTGLKYTLRYVLH